METPVGRIRLQLGKALAHPDVKACKGSVYCGALRSSFIHMSTSS
jgi:hypothetical protein